MKTAVQHPANQSTCQPPAGQNRKLLDRVRDAIRVRHDSRRTEEAYIPWIRRFIFFHAVRHPAKMGKEEVNQFLTHLAVKKIVSASTQNQAFSALLFLSSRSSVLTLPSSRRWFEHGVPSDCLMTRQEVKALLDQLEGVPLLVCTLLYGAGLRLLDCLRMRVKDIDFVRNEITVRDGKGCKDRVTMLPARAKQALLEHLQKIRGLHENDLRNNLGRAPLPGALLRKYPNADREWGWQYVFPASSHYTDSTTGLRHRHHVHETVIQKAVRETVRRACITKPASCHTFRHCFANQLLEDGYDIRTVQDLLGHNDVKTTRATRMF